MAPDPDTLLTRRDAARALTEVGYPIAWPTLGTLATRGGGPPFRHFGARVLYRWGDLLAWAEGRLSPPMCSTSAPGPRPQTRPGPRQSGQHPTP